MDRTGVMRSPKETALRTDERFNILGSCILSLSCYVINNVVIIVSSEDLLFIIIHFHTHTTELNNYYNS